jgi:hypothetical protein
MKLAAALAILLLAYGCQAKSDPRIAELQSEVDTLKSQNANLQQQQAAVSDIQQQPKSAGRYFTPDSLVSTINDPTTEKAAQLYLVGVYDLSQDSGHSCAVRGTTTPGQLEQVFSDYLKSHTALLHADRTAASVAAQAFTESWPCQK